MAQGQRLRGAEHGVPRRRPHARAVVWDRRRHGRDRCAGIDVVRAPPAWLVAEALGSPLTAGIDVETDICIAYDPRWIPGGDAGPNEELLVEVGTLRAWEGLGLGIDSAGQGRFVLVYATPEVAASDLEGRARLAGQGVRLVQVDLYAIQDSPGRGTTAGPQARPTKQAQALEALRR